MAGTGSDCVLKVLHFIPSLDKGGADNGAVELVRALNKIEGIEAKVCVMGFFHGGEMESTLHPPIFLGFSGSIFAFREFVKFRREIRRLISQEGITVVHCHLWPACRWVASALLGIRVRLVWHIRDTRPWLVEGGLRNMMLRAWTKFLIRASRPALIAVSRAAAGHAAAVLGVDRECIEIASSGVDEVKFKPRSSLKERKEKVIGTAAHFRPEKGHDVLLHAISILSSRGHAIKAMFAGEGQMLTPMKTLSVSLGISDQVAFLGRVKDMPGFLEQIDVFILPSIGMEGLPLSILEAMSMRIPVVATAVAGTPEIIRNGETGYLVPPRDAIALADAIEQAINARGCDDELLDRARSEVIFNHTSSRIAEKISRVYRKMADQQIHQFR